MISIIIPSYKGADLLRKHLPVLLKKIQSTERPFEIIIVDDGSDDQGATKCVADELRCVYIELEKNQGKGAAVRAGMKDAYGDYCFFTDCDIPFGAEALLLQLRFLEERNFDLVIGDRTLMGSQYHTKISFMRRLASGLFTFLVGHFITSGFQDTQCGLKGFRRSISDDLFNASLLNGFTFDVEILYIALKRKYKIKRMSVQFQGSQDDSTVSLTRHAPQMFLDLFRIRWNYLRGRYKRNMTSP
jgi:dolichyl-phosphate beta-glucosyltransferase